jgi:hypothetical protein
LTEILATYYNRDPNVVSREVAGERILVPIRKQTTGTAAIYVLNETGAHIWSLLDGHHSLAEIRDSLAAEYEVEPGTAQADLMEIVAQLQELGVIKVAADAV